MRFFTTHKTRRTERKRTREARELSIMRRQLTELRLRSQRNTTRY